MHFAWFCPCFLRLVLAIYLFCEASTRPSRRHVIWLDLFWSSMIERRADIFTAELLCLLRRAVVCYAAVFSVVTQRSSWGAGRSQESLEIEKLSRSIWYVSRRSVWLTKRTHDTWKVVKGMRSFNFDLIFDSDL